MFNRNISLAKILTVFCLAIPLMANEGCDPKERVLRKPIEVGSVAALDFTLPNGKKFDFANVLRFQTAGIISESSKYYVMNTMQIPHSQQLLRVSQEFGVPECLLRRPAATLNSVVLGFEFVTSGSITVGYSPKGEYGNNITGEVSVKVDRSQMDLYVEAVNRFKKEPIANSTVDSSQTKTNVSATVYYGDWYVKPEKFLETPLAKVTAKGFEKGLSKLSETLDKKPWEAQVVMDFDGLVQINAGRNANVVEGDEFEIYNYDLSAIRWEGEPCNSKLLSFPRQSSPATIVRITQVDDSDAYGVYVAEPDVAIHPGASVLVQKLVEKK